MKVLIVLTVILLAVVGIVVGIAAASPSPAATAGATPAGSASSPSSPHVQLESDRAMTAAMSASILPGMQPTNAMLQRSSDPAYVNALEQHTYAVDRMLARNP